MPSHWRSMTGAAAPVGDLYSGDCSPGDREATPEEIAAWMGRRAAPDSVSDLALRLALNALGLRKLVEDHVAASPQDVKDWWDRSPTIRRDFPMLVDAANALGIDLDAVFTLAATF